MKTDATVDAVNEAEPRRRPAAPRTLDQSLLTHLVGYAATRASVQLKKTFSKHMGPLNLKAVEFSILMLVMANDDVNQKQLGRALDVSAPNLAVILDKLAERGVIERVRGQQDRREQLLRLTAEGLTLAQRAQQIAQTMEHDAIAALSQAERLLLIELLQKVAKGTSRSADGSQARGSAD
ncbi:MAG: MarR family transcriptional regulator [Rhizobacter sp.]|nr:MarR family transcriptional regulator [Rhizobacter sp.]